MVAISFRFAFCTFLRLYVKKRGRGVGEYEFVSSAWKMKSAEKKIQVYMPITDAHVSEPIGMLSGSRAAANIPNALNAMLAFVVNRLRAFDKSCIRSRARLRSVSPLDIFFSKFLQLIYSIQVE